MAKYLVTSGSKFEPMSYDDLVKPLMQATEAHKQTQEVYDELAANAESVGALISEGDTMAKQMYDNYSQTLDTYINDLQANGYGLSAQRGLSQLRRQYGRDITSIQNAIARRRELANEFRTRANNDPTMITDFDPAQQSLDRWIENPEFGNYRATSGAFLQDQTSKLAATLKDQLAQRLTSLGYGNQYFETATFTGATQEQVDTAKRIFLAGEPAATGDAVTDALVDIMNNVYAGSGVNDWNTPEAALKAKQFIANGANSALGGAPKFETLSNKALGATGGTGGGSKGASGDKTMRGINWHWTSGILRDEGVSVSDAKRLEQHLALANKIKERGIYTNGQPTQDEIDDNIARNTALDSIQNYYTLKQVNPAAFTRVLNGKDLKRDGLEAKIKTAIDEYNKAIAQFPEYSELTYTQGGGRPSVGSGTTLYSTDNERFVEERNMLTPTKQFRELAKIYAPNKPDANIDDIIEGIHSYSNKIKSRGRLAQGDAFNADGISRWAKSYINETVANSGTARVKSWDGKPVSAAKAREALESNDTEYFIDPIAGEFVADYKGNVFRFNKMLFGSGAFGGDKDAIFKDILTTTNADEEAINKFCQIFNINPRSYYQTPLSIDEAMTALQKWVATNGNGIDDKYGLTNIAIEHIWDAINKFTTMSPQNQSSTAEIKP